MTAVFDRELSLYAFNRWYCHELTRGLTDEQFAHQPAPGVNPPLWILGHLTICTDYVLMLLGRPAACPRAWHQAFGPGSGPTPASPPTPADLLAAYDAGHARAGEAARAATPTVLAEPHAVEMAHLKRLLPTKGELIAHLLTTHEATHLGQLSAWRRSAGLPPVIA